MTEDECGVWFSEGWPRWLIWVLWLSLLISIPVTSFPLFAGNIAGRTISPLALGPLLLLIPLAVLPVLFSGRGLPRFVWPLLIFVGIALLATAAAPLLGLEPYKGRTVTSEGLEGAGTLLVGLGFFLAATCIPSNRSELRWSVLAATLGALLALAWSAVQVDYIFLDPSDNIPWRINEAHRLISTRDLLRDRITGLAFEPSWFGNQLVVLYLPLWLGALVSGQSMLGRRWGWLLELVLSLLAVAALVLARSRISAVSLGLILLLLAVTLLWRFSGRLSRWWGSRTARSAQPGSLPRTPRWVVFLLGSLLLALLIVGIVGVWLGNDPRMERALRLRSQFESIRLTHPETYIYEVANRMAFAERLVYWASAFEVFERYPVLGVGLGNSGLLFEQVVPSYGYRLTEIRAVLQPENPNLPNPKSLWLRLLAETGLLGTAAYLTWIIAAGTAAARLTRRVLGVYRLFGWAVLLSLAALMAEGFSLDTFALPQFWVLLGLMAAAVHLSAQGRAQET